MYVLRKLSFILKQTLGLRCISSFISKRTHSIPCSHYKIIPSANTGCLRDNAAAMPRIFVRLTRSLTKSSTPLGNAKFNFFHSLPFRSLWKSPQLHHLRPLFLNRVNSLSAQQRICTDSCASGHILVHICLFAYPVFLPTHAGMKEQVVVRASWTPTGQDWEKFHSLRPLRHPTGVWNEFPGTWITRKASVLLRDHL